MVNIEDFFVMPLLTEIQSAQFRRGRQTFAVLKDIKFPSKM